MRESDIQHEIIEWLEKHDFYVVKLIQTNKNGIPDLIVLKDGCTIFIEVKSEKGKVAELQKYRHKQLLEKGFYTIIAKSLKEVTHEFIKLSEELHQQRVISNLN